MDLSPEAVVMRAMCTDEEYDRFSRAMEIVYRMNTEGATE